MKYWTYLEIKTKIQSDLGAEDEDFVTENELLGYVNGGIEDVEKEIHTLYEDYFLSYMLIPLVNGVEFYSLPSDIFANKIRGIVYNDGSLEYTIRKLKEKHKFRQIADSKNLPNDQYYRYTLINRNKNNIPSTKLMLLPKAKETSPSTAAWASGTSYIAGDIVYYDENRYECVTPNSDVAFTASKWTDLGAESFLVTMWYIRNANRMVDDTSICDIPEFVSFIIQYAKVKYYEKEQSDNLTKATEELERIRVQLQETLRDMVPDEDTEVEMDLTIYEETV